MVQDRRYDKRAGKLEKTGKVEARQANGRKPGHEPGRQRDDLEDGQQGKKDRPKRQGKNDLAVAGLLEEEEQGRQENRRFHERIGEGLHASKGEGRSYDGERQD